MSVGMSVPVPVPKDARDTRDIRNTFTFRINSLELRLQTDYTLTLHKLIYICTGLQIGPGFPRLPKGSITQWPSWIADRPGFATFAKRE